MSKETNTKKATKTKSTNKPIEKTVLEPRVHFNEFIHTNHPDMGKMDKAGFKAFIGNVLWQRPKEWKDSYTKYNNRNK